MTASIDELIAVEVRKARKCQVCNALDELEPEVATKWQQWAEGFTNRNGSARVLAGLTRKSIAHSRVDAHITEKHGAGR